MAAAAGGDGGWGSLGQLPTPLHSTRLRSAVLCAVLLLATTPSEEEVAAEEVADAWSFAYGAQELGQGKADLIWVSGVKGRPLMIKMGACHLFLSLCILALTVLRY
jgi:hypothetical protein